MPSAPRLVLTALSLGAAASAQAPGAAIDFDRDIRPILADRCFACHGPDAGARKAKLRLDTFAGATAKRDRGAALVPGDPQESLIVQRLRHPDPKKRMPPAKSKLTIAEPEIRLIERWIASGGGYTRHWAFVPPRRTRPPATRRRNWARDPLDRFVLARLESLGLDAAPEAARATWLRRVSFALTGLGPTPEELSAFAADRSETAHSRVVDRLLASPRFGERMAADWLDVARYADTYGYQADVDRRVWPYRDWVIRAFNDNLPYDRFVTWQLAGDLLPDATREQKLATAFNRLHRQTNEGGSVEEEFRVEYVGDRTETFATAFLGLTLGCAKCHDHKFDPILQREYYRLSAFFDDIDESGLYSHFTRATPTPALLLPNAEQEHALDSARNAVAAAEHRLRSVVRGRQAAFAKWLAGPAQRLAGGKRDARVPGRVGHYPLDALHGAALDNGVAPGDPKQRARTFDGPKTIPGVTGNGVLLDGENNVSFPIGAFRRTDPFTVALWLRVPARYERAVVFHRSRAWTDSGSQGYQLLIEDGRLSVSVIHFWPGDAIRVRSVAPLPIGEWVHVAVGYDGSSRAAGLRIFVGGAPVPVTTVRDHLVKSALAAGVQLTIGQRFRDKGLKGGAVDELEVFDRALSALEVRELARPGTLAAALRAGSSQVAGPRYELREYFLAAVDPEVQAARAKLRERRRALAALLDLIPEIMTMRDRPEPRAAWVLARGSYEARTGRVGPGTPRALPPFDSTLPRNRLGLARWLTDPAHPLTARVAVNRLWYLLFGRGLVPTLENFGTQGEPPVHRELLDWLATRLVDSGWDVKAMLKRIALSATYRQSSARADRDRDPDNRLLARGPSFRLPAEMLRDHALHASGLLVEKLGGKSVKPYQPPGLWLEKSGKLYRADSGPGLYRRSLYTFWKRTSPPPSMMLFDAAKRDVCVARRQVTDTPLQALVLLNDPQFVEAARELAARSMREAPEPRTRLRAAFVRLSSRAPTDRELAILQRLLRRQVERFAADPRAASQILKIGARRADPRLDARSLAAYAVVVSTVMSSDAAVMVR